MQLLNPKKGSCLCVEIGGQTKTTNNVRIWLITDVLSWCLKDVIGMSCFMACTETCFEIYFLDIFKTSKIISNLGDIISAYQQPKIDKRSAKHWQKLPKMFVRKVVPTSVQYHPNISSTLAQCQPNVSNIGPTVKSMLWQCCRANIGPAFAGRSAQCWSDLLMLSGYEV